MVRTTDDDAARAAAQNTVALLREAVMEAQHVDGEAGGPWFAKASS
jgi:hypothetical protein